MPEDKDPLDYKIVHCETKKIAGLDVHFILSEDGLTVTRDECIGKTISFDDIYDFAFGQKHLL